MKTQTQFTVLFLIISLAANAQTFVGLNFTSKFIGKTVALDFERQYKRHAFSASLLFYTNQKSDALYGISKRDYPLCPVHFNALKDEAYAENIMHRFGFFIGYDYHLREQRPVIPYLSIGVAVSNIGFRQQYFPDSPQTISSPRFVTEFFPAAGLKIRLYKNIYLKQSISPGLLYINHSPFNSFSINPTYTAGIALMI